MLAIPFATAACLLAACGALSPPPLGSTVMGVDFGSQFIKMATVAPGEDEPFPIMLNDMTERKTVNAVTYRENKVLFGPHALKSMLNQPERGYIWMNGMLGKKHDDPAVARFLDFTAAKFGKDPATGSIVAVIENDKSAPVEYLSAMLLAKLVSHSEVSVHKTVRSVVITVPPYFGQNERQAILDVASIAGITVLSLVNDISAAALHYGTFSTTKITGPRHIILFDSGATHTSAAIVFIHPDNMEKGVKTAITEVKHIVTDTNLHGLNVDRAVSRILARKFAEANDGLEIPLGKAYNRLQAESGRFKQILSANKEIRATIEEISDNRTLSAKLTREELEAECAEYHGLASSLIHNLLKEAGMTLEEIDAIIPIGGNSRVPFVQADLNGAFDKKVQYTLNMDDTVVQGAAFYAATLARYRVKPVKFRDSYPFSVSLKYGLPMKELFAGDTSPSSILLYPANSHVEGHKAVSFKNMNSIDCVVNSPSQGNLLQASIGGMAEILEKFKKTNNVNSTKLKFWVDLNSSGMLEIKDAPVALIEYVVEQEKTMPKTVAPPEDSASDTPAPDPATVPNAAAAPDAATTSETEYIVKTSTIPLSGDIKSLHTKIPSAICKSWGERIRESRELERLAVAKSAARNALESKVYQTRDFLKVGPLVKFTKPQEKATIEASLESASILLDEDEESVARETYESELATLLVPLQAIKSRSEEHTKRPAAILLLRDHIGIAQDYVARMRSDFPDASTRAQSDEDLERLESRAKDIAEWMKGTDEEKAKGSPIDLTQDPSILCSEVEDQMKGLAYLHKSISSKALPPPPVSTPADEKASEASANVQDTTAPPAQPEGSTQSAKEPSQEEAILGQDSPNGEGAKDSSAATMEEPAAHDDMSDEHVKLEL